MVYCVLYNKFFFNGNKNVQVGSGSVTNWPTGSGSGIQDNGFAVPDPKEIFTDATLMTVHREKKTKREESEEDIIALLAYRRLVVEPIPMSGKSHGLLQLFLFHDPKDDYMGVEPNS